MPSSSLGYVATYAPPAFRCQPSRTVLVPTACARGKGAVVTGKSTIPIQVVGKFDFVDPPTCARWWTE
eukprot:5357351-Pyramimonas_sp.AAC.1